MSSGMKWSLERRRDWVSMVDMTASDETAIRSLTLFWLTGRLHAPLRVLLSALGRQLQPLALRGGRTGRAARRPIVLGVAGAGLAERAVGGGDEDPVAREARIGRDRGVADGPGGQALGRNGLQVRLVQPVPHLRGLREIGLGAVPAAGAVRRPLMLLQAGRGDHAEMLAHRLDRNGRAGRGAIARVLVVRPIGPQAVQGQAELIGRALIAGVGIVLAAAAGLRRPADRQ